jgi:hypothetical protein
MRLAREHWSHADPPREQNLSVAHGSHDVPVSLLVQVHRGQFGLTMKIIHEMQVLGSEAHATAVWEWVLQNKTWLFDGLGITVLGIVWWAIKKMASSGAPAAPSSATIPPQFNINVSPNISPVFSPTQSNIQTTPTAPDSSGKHPTTQDVPDIRFIRYGSEFVPRIGTGKRCFVLFFRNDGPADAKDVLAHISYRRSPGHPMVVDYGAWVENDLINIFRGHTKRLIFAVSEDGKNFAVNDTGPSTNYTDARLQSVGEIKPAEWQMVVTLSADNFRRDYAFNLIVGENGNLLCYPEGVTPPPQKHDPPKPDATAQPNVCSLLPQIATVVYDEESDVWSRGSGEGAVPAALLAFSNEPKELKKTASVQGITARLTFYESDGIKEFRRIDSGCWTGNAYRYADLEVGDIVYLIAAIQANEWQGATVENPRRSAARYDKDQTIPEVLPIGIYEVKVDLIGEDGEYKETYWFQLKVGEQLQVKRINQRPA